MYDKQTNLLKTPRLTEVSYEIAHYIAKRGESIASESRLYPPNEKPGLRHEGAWPLVEFSAIGASSGKTLYKCIYIHCNSEACVQLKVTNYIPQITELSKGKH